MKKSKAILNEELMEAACLGYAPECRALIELCADVNFEGLDGGRRGRGTSGRCL